MASAGYLLKPPFGVPLSQSADVTYRYNSVDLTMHQQHRPFGQDSECWVSSVPHHYILQGTRVRSEVMPQRVTGNGRRYMSGETWGQENQHGS